MNLVDGTGDVVPEPHWRILLTDEIEIEAATDHWRRITTEMRERNTLSAANGHSVQRLIFSYIVYDRCFREVSEHGAVLKPRRGNAKAIARHSPHYTAMREAAADAVALEAELGLSPRRRNGAAKVERKARTARAADTFLKALPGK